MSSIRVYAANVKTLQCCARATTVVKVYRSRLTPLLRHGEKTILEGGVEGRLYS